MNIFLIPDRRCYKIHDSAHVPSLCLYTRVVHHTKHKDPRCYYNMFIIFIYLFIIIHDVSETLGGRLAYLCIHFNLIVKFHVLCLQYPRHYYNILNRIWNAVLHNIYI